MLIVFLIFPVLGIIGAAILALSSGVGRQTPLPTPEPISLQDTTLVDQAAPNFELSGLDDKRYRLSSFRGRPVFVNFWGTWCEPCQRELPAFEQFQAAQGENGAVILAVNVGETADAINQYFNDHSIAGLTVLLDAKQDISYAYDVQRFPTTYLIDSAGVVRFKYLGEMKLDDMTAALQKVS
jgi:thiol-disulfide isomerase/thioredoxin